MRALGVQQSSFVATFVASSEWELLDPSVKQNFRPASLYTAMVVSSVVEVILVLLLDLLVATCMAVAAAGLPIAVAILVLWAQTQLAATQSANLTALTLHDITKTPWNIGNRDLGLHTIIVRCGVKCCTHVAY